MKIKADGSVMNFCPPLSHLTPQQAQRGWPAALSSHGLHHEPVGTEGISVHTYNSV